MVTTVLVIPCHNDGATLPRAVASASSQVDEVIIVNDGSDHETRVVMKDLWRAYKNITPIYTPSSVPLGVVAARNIGISHAPDNSLILPLDADDELLPGAVEAFTAAYQPDSFVVSGWVEQYADGSQQSFVPPALNMIATKNIGYATFLFSKASWLRAGGYPPHFELGGEHWGFMARLLRHKTQGIRLEHPLYIYHRQESRRAGIATRRFQWMQVMVQAELHGLPAHT